MKKILLFIIIAVVYGSANAQSISGDIGWGKINGESAKSIYTSLTYQQSINDGFGILADPFLIYNFEYRSTVGNPVLFGITGGVYVNLLNLNKNLLQVRGAVGGAYCNVDQEFRFASKLSLSYDYFITEKHAIGISGGVGLGKVSMGFISAHYLFNFKDMLHKKTYLYNSKSYYSLRIKLESITPLSVYSTTVSFNIINDWTFGDVFAVGIGIGLNYSIKEWDPFIYDFSFPVYMNSMMYLGKGQRIRPYLIMQSGFVFSDNVASTVIYTYDVGGGVAFKCDNNSLSIESRIRSNFDDEFVFKENSFIISVFYSFSFRKRLK